MPFLLYLVVLFPLWSGFGFTVGRPLIEKAARVTGDRTLASAMFYLLLVMVPAILIAVQAARGGELTNLGLNWPTIPGGHIAGLATLWSGLLGALVGCLLYYNELLLTALLGSSRRHGAAPLQRIATDGDSEAREDGAGWLNAFLSIAAPTALAEEFVWRGFLIFALTRESGLNLMAAVTISSVLFGANHVWFGARNVVLKTLDGFVWAALFLGSSSLVAPVMSHLTFQYFVGRGIRRRAMRLART